MNPLRIISSEVVGTTGFVESAFADCGSVSITTTGVTAATEVQHIDVDELIQATYKIGYDATSITTASLDATPTIAELVTAITGHADYGDLPFTVAAGTGDQLALTWAAAGTIAELAFLEIPNRAAGTTAETTAGDAETAELQTVSGVVLEAKAYELGFDGTILSATLAANVGQGVTVDELVNQFQIDADYIGLAVHIEVATANSFTVQWAAVGAVAYAVDFDFTDYSASTAGAVRDTVGATAATEVRSVTPDVLDPLSLYQLTVQDVVLTAAAVDATPTVAEIVNLLDNDADYGAAPFTIAEAGGAIVITWKAAGTIAAPSAPDEFEYRARVEGPYSAVIASGVRVVRVAPIVACHVAIGKNAEATATSLYMPAGTVEYFSTSPGERVSVKASSGEGNVSVSQMSG